MKAVREYIPFPRESSIHYEDVPRRGLDCDYHFHSEYEITYIARGRGQRLIGDHLGEFGPGDFVFIGAGLPHLYRNWENEDYYVKVIQFLPDCFGKGFFDLPECREIKRLLARSASGLEFAAKPKARAVELFLSIFEEQIPFRRLRAMLELLDVMAQKSASRQLASNCFDPSKTRHHIERMNRVLDYVRNHWNEDIRLADASKIAGMQSEAFSRFFRKKMGRTFQQYLIQWRLGQAASRLLDADASVSQIAFDCGFNNLSNFNRLFRVRYGKAPRQYRRELS